MPVETKPWYLIDDVSQIDSPALVIYLERVKRNISLAIETIGDVSRLRPHVKTHKSPSATELMLKAGITKFKCATIAEAEMLAQCKAPDVLFAYQPTGPKIGRFLTLIQQFPNTKFSCLIDTIDAAQAISGEAIARDSIVDVFIDVNVGMNRTGILPQKAIELYTACKAFRGLKLRGVHGYDGHINDADFDVRKQRADEAFSKLMEVQSLSKASGFWDPAIIVGGSPTFSIHAKRSGVECSPGTFVYWDKSYSDALPDIDFLPAALVVTRVVSVVNETTICLDLGHKSVAAENPLARRVHFMNTDGLTPVGHSEEHLVVETSTVHHYQVGDVLYGMPFHVCPTCALYDTAFVIEDHIVKETWHNIARDRKLSI